MERFVYAVYAEIYMILYKLLAHFEKKCLQYESRFWRKNNEQKR